MVVRNFLAFLSLLLFTPAIAQLPVTLRQCEALFQKNNLLLLAETYQISAAEAKVIQAKIWERPYFSSELNAVHAGDDRLFNIGNQGEKVFSVEQLIYLGGKKRKEVAFYKSNVALAHLQFEQLLRKLRFEIGTNFYAIYFNQLKEKNLASQLSSIDTLIYAYTQQATLGNAPLRDVARLQSLSLSFRSEMMNIQKNLISEMENIKVLLHSDSSIVPMITDADMQALLKRDIPSLLDQLQEKALQSNPEYLTALKMIESSELNLQWQKSMAFSDLTLGSSYDQRGGAFDRQVNLTLGIPIPLWNSHRGDIKIAESEKKYNETMKDIKAQEIKSNIREAVSAFTYQRNQYLTTRKMFDSSVEVYNGILKNFQSRNISLIEFTDFMESYNQGSMFMYDSMYQLILSGETINYLTNEKIF